MRQSVASEHGGYVGLGKERKWQRAEKEMGEEEKAAQVTLLGSVDIVIQVCKKHEENTGRVKVARYKHGRVVDFDLYTANLAELAYYRGRQKFVFLRQP